MAKNDYTKTTGVIHENVTPFTLDDTIFAYHLPLLRRLKVLPLSKYFQQIDYQITVEVFQSFDLFTDSDKNVFSLTVFVIEKIKSFLDTDSKRKFRFFELKIK